MNPKKVFMSLGIALLCVIFISSASFSVSGAQATSGDQLIKRIAKELRRLPHYGVFDNLAFTLDGQTVTLMGQVILGVTQKDAERRVSRIKGVEKVVNQIELLPLSANDDHIRMKMYREIFNSTGLYIYAMGPDPSIHIIVKDGHVTLEGVVGSEADSQFALMSARKVPGVFSVTNHLRVEK